MASFSDPLPFPTPAWLVEHSEPHIDAVVEGLSDESRQLYRRYLAEEVRSVTPSVILPAWRAFDRAMCEVLRRNKERREA